MAAGHTNAQVVWGSKTRYGTPPDIAYIPTLLFRYDEGENAITVIDSVQRSGGDIEMDGLACTPTLGLVAWEVTETGSQMVRIDSLTAEAVDFGAFMPGTGIRGACFDHTDDILALDFIQDDLLRVRTTDGTVATSHPLTLSGDAFDLTAGCDIEFISGFYYIHHGTSLYTVDTLTGDLDLVFTDTNVDTTDVLGNCFSNQYPPGMGGIAAINGGEEVKFVSLDGNCEEDLYSYTSLTPAGRVEVVNDITPGFNSGALDLASNVQPLTSAIGSMPSTVPLFSVHWSTLGLQIISTEPMRGSIHVFDASGRSVTSVRGNGTTRQLLPLEVTPGVYQLRLDGGGTGSGRFLVP